jgi:dolichol-phosphate mannosyltransferase
MAGAWRGVRDIIRALRTIVEGGSPALEAVLPAMRELVYADAALGIDLSDPMSGYFMVRRAAIAGVTMHPLGYKILVEVIGRGRVRWIAEVGYVFRERHEGQSKVTWRVYVDYLRHLVRLRLSALSTSRFLRFALVGASGVLVDMAVLFLLSDPRSLGLGLTRSKIVAA